MILNVFVGFDSSDWGQELAYEICRRSLIKNHKAGDIEIRIKPLIKKELEEMEIFWRKDKDGSTEFTYTRFLTPYLSNYEGYSIFCDSDFLWNCDIVELLNYIKKDLAVSCVKHSYNDCNDSVKMNGLKQEWYPRKNWTSLMIFNNEHPSVKNLSLENVNNQTAKWLHRLQWCSNEEIGSIPLMYNYLAGYYTKNVSPKAIHYTDGGPWHYKYTDTDFAQEWLDYLTEKEMTKLETFILYSKFKYEFFVMVGPNVIESKKHTLYMAEQVSKICRKLNVNFVFKVSFDKANRTSINSYRGVDIKEAIEIFKEIKSKYNCLIITDIHEDKQADMIKDYVDVIQVPAFLCRQTNLLKAVADTNKLIHVKKGQFCTPETMHKCAEKIRNFGNPNVILCERGSMFGYRDLIVDSRNIPMMKSGHNLVSMDITHCLQQPSQKLADGTVKAGGLREYIPLMGKLAIISGVNGIFMETHDRPEESLCDAPTQFPLKQLENFIEKMIKLYHFHKSNF